MSTYTGTEGDDRVVYYGNPPGDTSGDDTINTFGGNDTIITGGGFDTVNAGTGDDRLESGGPNQGYNADLGEGNDFAFLSLAQNSTINLGAGNDWAFLQATNGSVQTLTLGGGRDNVSLRYGGTYIITDFQTGAGGDTLQFLQWFMASGTAGQWWFDFAALGPHGVPNPFGTGFAQLVDSVAGALLQVRSLISGPWTTLVTFQSLTVAQFHADNFLGWAPNGAAPPSTTLNITEASVQFGIVDTYGDDTINGSDSGGYIHYTGGNDIIYGGAGNDQITSTNYFASGFKTIYAGAGDDIAGVVGFEGYARDQNGWPVADTVWGIVHGDDGNDSVAGGWGNDQIYGDAGNDFANGGGGNDYVDGGTGDDRVIGGPGSDIVVGGPGVDSLSGGTQSDTFRDTAANFSGDTIDDFTKEDKIIITDASIGNFSFSLSDHTLTYTGGSLTLGTLPTGTIVASAAPDGGVQLRILEQNALNDFNGDRRSDIIVRDSQSGWLTDWLGASNGSLASNSSNLSVQFPADWKVAGGGDYNGDGRDDLLLRNDAGWLTNWLGTASGGLSNNGANASLFFAPEWKVTGNGDFNGDGKADLLLRRDDGWLTNWLGTSTGSFANNGANTSLFFTTDWKIASTGDFNGDGYTDLLLRRDDGWVTNWLGNASGGFTNNGANTALFFTLDWKVIGTGDINGDGKDDLILRRDDGWITDWLGTANGGFTNNGANTALFLTTDWKISSIADFNGDGREDILLRNDSGWMTNWLGTGTGSFTNNGANFSTFIASNWVVQDPFM